MFFSDRIYYNFASEMKKEIIASDVLKKCMKGNNIITGG
jgi:hypothetical protein